MSDVAEIDMPAREDAEPASLDQRVPGWRGSRYLQGIQDASDGEVDIGPRRRKTTRASPG